MLLPRLILLAALLCPLRAVAADDSFAPITPAMQKFIDQGELAGIVTLVASKDKILHQSAVGTSDGSRKMQPDDLFWIASMSKPMTAVAAAMLVDDGKLSFDDPIEKFVPEFKNLRTATAPAKRPILLKDLLTHTSGLAYNYTTTEPHWTLPQYAKQIASQPLEFQPGEHWYYSNAAFDVIGLVIERAAGIPFDQFMQKRLFDPVHMKDTTFWISDQQLTRYAHAYTLDTPTQKLREIPCVGLNGSEITDKNRAPGGAAGIFSTAQDVARFYQMMLNGGKVDGKQLLSPASFDRLTKNQIANLEVGSGLTWAYGFALIDDPAALSSNAMLARHSFGHTGIFGTNAWADPTSNAIYIILFERDLPLYFDSPMRTQFQSLAAKALKNVP